MKLTSLPERYITALRKYLKQGSAESLQLALKLGREAVTFGLETLELTGIHERALIALELSKGRGELMQRAGIFLAKAIAPILDTRRSARQSRARLNRLKATLVQRTKELAATSQQLKRGVTKHRLVEKAARKNDENHRKALEESLALQQRLRQLTHQVIAAQENDRRKISRELQDEIAQTLLGINVRLLTLKQGDRDNTKFIKNEIASTQRLVVKSARTVRRYARKLEVHKPA